MKSRPIVILAACMPMLAATCAPSHLLLARLAVDRAVYEVVKGHPERPARIVEIITVVEATISNDSAANAKAIVDAVRHEIDFDKLAPPDRSTVNTLLQLVEVELQRQLDKLMLPEEDKLLPFRTVAGWIKETATLYIPPSPVQPLA